MSNPGRYSWDQMYLDEYAKGKRPFHGKEPDGFVVWASKYLQEKGMRETYILDAGCGEGRNSIYLAKQGFKVHGIDIASPAIETGKEWAKSEGLSEKVNLRVGDVTKLPWDDCYFDAIYDSFTMEFVVKKKPSYVKEVVRVLKPKGLFFILTHILPAKHGLDPEALIRMLEKNFQILNVNQSNSSMTMVAMKK